MKISERWKRPFRFLLILLLLGIFLVMNKWGINFQISFHFKSTPIEREIPDDDSRQVALEIQSFEDPVIRYRDGPA